MTRFRKRFPVWQYYNNTALWIKFMETFHESSFPGPCNCTHIRHISLISGVSSNGSIYGNVFPENPPTAANPTKLDWDKLPTSSEFGLIQFFAELDDTLALFSKKLLSNISYGSVNWGILPFISDVQAIAKLAANLLTTSDFSHTMYENGYTTQYQLNSIGSYGDRFVFDFSTKYTMSGSVNLPIGSLQAILDIIGFHPDIATLWDLIPMSFLIDYLLPIGDFLDSLTNRGWLNYLTFTGWRTAKSNVKWHFYPSNGAMPLFGGSYNVFERCNNSIVLTKESEKSIGEISSDPLSFRECFNILYVLFSNRTR